jgi:hypothetical protein
MSNNDSFSNFVAPENAQDDQEKDQELSPAQDLNLKELAEETNVDLDPDHLKRDNINALNKVEQAALKAQREEKKQKDTGIPQHDAEKKTYNIDETI